MNQGDLAIDEATDKNLRRLGDRFKNCVDAMALRVCPPATFDGFADNGLGEAGDGSLGRGEYDTVLPDESQRLLGGRALAHDTQLAVWISGRQPPVGRPAESSGK